MSAGCRHPRPMLASPNTTTPATAAPRNANQMYWNGSESPNTAITVTTANEAPEFTPSRPVSAIGLRVYPWISAPPTPRATPATIASTVRGTRTVRTMSRISVSRWSDSGAANSPCHTSPGLNARAPTANDAAPAATRTSTSTPRPTTRRRRARVVALNAGRSTAIVPMSTYVIPFDQWEWQRPKGARGTARPAPAGPRTQYGLTGRADASCPFRRRPSGPRRKRTGGPGRGASRGSRRP
ncbi:hypothetical protein QFZ43_001148 [Streptomyces afghaniensis]|nr:hypothetical protein [Streptomyces afghaniensis]